MSHDKSPTWEFASVQSPHLNQPVSILAARDIPYLPKAHRFQTLTIYIPNSPESQALVNTTASTIPTSKPGSASPSIYVHIHGGAWRDPNLTSASLEATVAHAFSSPTNNPKLSAIVSLNYTLTHFPTHPTQPYDKAITQPTDPSRSAVHPTHIHDILHAFAFLRNMGLSDSSYVLSGHSAGACLAFQAILRDPGHWMRGHGAADDQYFAPPRPAALIGMNGLYDLPDLVRGLGAGHGHLADVYRDLLGNAFGSDEGEWVSASPARVEKAVVESRLKEGKIPGLVVVVDQSVEDQLVPVNQADKMEQVLKGVEGLRVMRGKRCTGVHAAPWEQGYMIWEELRDVFEFLKDGAVATSAE